MTPFGMLSATVFLAAIPDVIESWHLTIPTALLSFWCAIRVRHRSMEVGETRRAWGNALGLVLLAFTASYLVGAFGGDPTIMWAFRRGLKILLFVSLGMWLGIDHEETEEAVAAAERHRAEIRSRLAG